MHVCRDHELDTHDSRGGELSATELDMLLRTVQDICSEASQVDPAPTVTCIYRKTTATTWRDCDFGAGTTCVYTSELAACVPTGIYEGYATLFVNGVKKLRDYGTATVG